MILSSDPDTNEASYQDGFTGVTKLGNAGYTLMRFDLGFIPSNALITSATVFIQPTYTRGIGTVNAHNILGPWDPDTVTWDNFNVGFDSTVAGSFTSGTEPWSDNAVAASGTDSFDLADLTRQWVTGAVPNYGILLEQNIGQDASYTYYDLSQAEDLQVFYVCYAPDCTGVADGTPCDDGDPTTAGDVCAAGVCAGFTSVTVPADSEIDLGPGSYGAVVVEENAVLRLTGGDYEAFSLSVASGGQIITEDESLLRITTTMFADVGTSIGPDPALGVAMNLRIEIMGADIVASNLFIPAVFIGSDTSVATVIFAPNATVQIGDYAQITDAIAGLNVVLGAGVTYPLMAYWTTDPLCKRPCYRQPVCNPYNHNCTCSPVTCVASDKCHLTGVCLASTSKCTNPPITCSAKDQCHLAGTCNLSTGECTNPLAPADTPCDDPLCPMAPGVPTPWRCNPSHGGVCASCKSAALWFSSDMYFNRPVDTADLDPESDAIIATLQNAGSPGSMGGWGHGEIRINFTIDVFYATADANPIRVTYDSADSVDNNDGSTDVPVGGIPIPSMNSTTSPTVGFESPMGMTCPLDEDCHYLVMDPAYSRLIEAYQAQASTTNFIVGPNAGYPGIVVVWDYNLLYPAFLRGDPCTSADASGGLVAPLLFTAEELHDGHIDHAIRFVLPNSRIQYETFVRPATHATMSFAHVNGVPYGARFRLKSDDTLREVFGIDVTTLSKGAQVIVKALQKYGMILSDGGSDALTAKSDQFTNFKYGDQPNPLNVQSGASFDLNSLPVDAFDMVVGTYGTGFGPTTLEDSTMRFDGTVQDCKRNQGL
jgi:serine/threonine-protein kinase